MLLGRAAFGLVAEAQGDRGLGPVIAAHPELVEEVAVDGGNPDVDTRADLVALIERAWAARVVANRDQVDRFREIPDGTDFYAPVSGLFRADPRRTDDASLDVLRRHLRPGETWLDIGAGAGRYALPIAADLAASGGRVIALDPSRGMLGALRELATEFTIDNVEVDRGSLAARPMPRRRRRSRQTSRSSRTSATTSRRSGRSCGRWRPRPGGCVWRS